LVIVDLKIAPTTARKMAEKKPAALPQRVLVLLAKSLTGQASY